MQSSQLFSDNIKSDVVYKADYLRDINHNNEPVRFGDIIPLARGRLERIDDGYVLVEIDQKTCGKNNCTTINNELDKNVTALWMVERIRHRDPSRGHTNELKLTVFPMKKHRFENKRETIYSRSRSSNSVQLKPRSFVIRDKDYPKYFSNESTLQNPSNKIQKRTFDMLAPFTQSSFDNYRLPLHFNYRRQFNSAEELNTGEYYAGDEATSAFYPPLYPTSQYSSQEIGNQLHRPNHIRFPTATGIVNDQQQLISHENVQTTPFTATHLHHHFYLNKQNVPLIKTTAYEKEHIYSNANQPFTTDNNVQHNSDHQILSPTHEPQNLSIDSYGNTVQSNDGYTEHPRSNYQLFDPNIHQGAYQTPFSLPDQVPPPQPTTTTVNSQLYQHQTQYPYSPQLQLISPPHQTQQYYNQADIPLTTAQYIGAPVPQFNHNQLFIPVSNLPPPSVTLHEAFHPNGNFVGATAASAVPFQGNLKYENNKFSDPDPIYHQQFAILQDHFGPHLLPHLHGPSIFQGSPYLPTTTNSDTTTDAPTKHTLPIGKGSYDIIPEKQKLATPDDTINMSIVNQNDDQKENQTIYPDSINAQLPPPEHDDDLTVPYVDSTIIVENENTSEITKSLDNKTIQKSQLELGFEDTLQKHLQKFRQEQTTTTPPPLLKHSTILTPVSSTSEKTKRHRHYFQPKSTEKPILKWMPKRTKSKTSKEDLELYESNIDSTTTYSPSTTSSTSTSTENVITVTPVHDTEEESRTSISTSISIRVGSQEDLQSNNSSIRPKTLKINETESFNDFLPTLLPTNLQLTRSNITTINTNSSDLKLFRASEADDKIDEYDSEEHHIARSILNHAQRLY